MQTSCWACFYRYLAWSGKSYIKVHPFLRIAETPLLWGIGSKIASVCLLLLVSHSRKGRCPITHISTLAS